MLDWSWDVERRSILFTAIGLVEEWLADVLKESAEHYYNVHRDDPKEFYKAITGNEVPRPSVFFAQEVPGETSKARCINAAVKRVQSALELRPEDDDNVVFRRLGPKCALLSWDVPDATKLTWLKDRSWSSVDVAASCETLKRLKGVMHVRGSGHIEKVAAFRRDTMHRGNRAIDSSLSELRNCVSENKRHAVIPAAVPEDKVERLLGNLVTEKLRGSERAKKIQEKLWWEDIVYYVTRVGVCAVVAVLVLAGLWVWSLMKAEPHWVATGELVSDKDTLLRCEPPPSVQSIPPMLGVWERNWAAGEVNVDPKETRNVHVVISSARTSSFTFQDCFSNRVFVRPRLSSPQTPRLSLTTPSSAHPISVPLHSILHRIDPHWLVHELRSHCAENLHVARFAKSRVPVQQVFQPLDMHWSDSHEDAAVELDELLNRLFHSPKLKLWVEAMPGMGKTTLFKYIAARWGRRDLPVEFDAVIYLPLRAIKAFPALTAPASSTTAFLARILANEFRTLLEVNPKREFLAAIEMDEEHKIAIWERLVNLLRRQTHVLWLADGLDELNALEQEYARNTLNSLDTVMISSRPRGSVGSLHISNKVVVGGLALQGQQQVVRAIAGPHGSDAALAFNNLLLSSPPFRAMARTPIMLEILFAVSERESIEKIVPIFDKAVDFLLMRWAEKKAPAQVEEFLWEHSTRTVREHARAAFSAWQRNDTVLLGSDLLQALDNPNPSFSTLVASFRDVGLVSPLAGWETPWSSESWSSEAWAFPHKSFFELFVVKQWEFLGMDVVAWVEEHAVDEIDIGSTQWLIYLAHAATEDVSIAQKLVAALHARIPILSAPQPWARLLNEVRDPYQVLPNGVCSAEALAMMALQHDARALLGAVLERSSPSLSRTSMATHAINLNQMRWLLGSTNNNELTSSLPRHPQDVSFVALQASAAYNDTEDLDWYKSMLQLDNSTWFNHLLSLHWPVHLRAGRFHLCVWNGTFPMRRGFDATHYPTRQEPLGRRLWVEVCREWRWGESVETGGMFGDEDATRVIPQLLSEVHERYRLGTTATPFLLGLLAFKSRSKVELPFDDVLWEIIREESADVEVRVAAARVVFAWNRFYKSEFCEIAVSPLLNVTGNLSTPASVRRSAVNVLRYCSRRNSMRAQGTEAMGLLKELADQIVSGRSVHDAVEQLHLISTNIYMWRPMMVEAGAIQALMSLIQNSASSDLSRALDALKSLASDNNAASLIFESPSTLHALVGMIERRSSERHKAVSLLLQLTSHGAKNVSLVNPHTPLLEFFVDEPESTTLNILCKLGEMDESVFRRTQDALLTVFARDSGTTPHLLDMMNGVSYCGGSSFFTAAHASHLIRLGLAWEHHRRENQHSGTPKFGWEKWLVEHPKMAIDRGVIAWMAKFALEADENVFHSYHREAVYALSKFLKSPVVREEVSKAWRGIGAEEVSKMLPSRATSSELDPVRLTIWGIPEVRERVCRGLSGHSDNQSKSVEALFRLTRFWRTDTPLHPASRDCLHALVQMLYHDSTRDRAAASLLMLEGPKDAELNQTALRTLTTHASSNESHSLQYLVELSRRASNDTLRTMVFPKLVKRGQLGKLISTACGIYGTGRLGNRFYNIATDPRIIDSILGGLGSELSAFDFELLVHLCSHDPEAFETIAKRGRLFQRVLGQTSFPHLPLTIETTAATRVRLLRKFEKRFPHLELPIFPFNKVNARIAIAMLRAGWLEALLAVGNASSSVEALNAASWLIRSDMTGAAAERFVDGGGVQLARELMRSGKDVWDVLVPLWRADSSDDSILSASLADDDFMTLIVSTVLREFEVKEDCWTFSRRVTSFLYAGSLRARHALMDSSDRMVPTILKCESSSSHFFGNLLVPLVMGTPTDPLGMVSYTCFHGDSMNEFPLQSYYPVPGCNSSMYEYWYRSKEPRALHDLVLDDVGASVLEQLRNAINIPDLIASCKTESPPSTSCNLLLSLLQLPPFMREIAVEHNVSFLVAPFPTSRDMCPYFLQPLTRHPDKDVRYAARALHPRCKRKVVSTGLRCCYERDCFRYTPDEAPAPHHNSTAMPLNSSSVSM